MPRGAAEYAYGLIRCADLDSPVPEYRKKREVDEPVTTYGVEDTDNGHDAAEIEDVVLDDKDVSLRNQLLIYFCKLRTNLTYQQLAPLARLSPSWLSCTVRALLHARAPMVQASFGILSGDALAEKTTAYAKHSFPNKAVHCTDTTYIYMEKSGHLVLQYHTWSRYKAANLVKVLVLVTTTGWVEFVGEAKFGKSTDEQVWELSSVNVLLDDVHQKNPNEPIVVLSDKGFEPEGCTTENVEIERPTKRKAGQQDTGATVFKHYSIASNRIVVENLFARMRHFHFVGDKIPTSMLATIDEWMRETFYLINHYYEPLRKPEWWPKNTKDSK